jgi:hypothetical protein
MKLLYAVCNTHREREDGSELHMQIGKFGKCALNKGNSTTLRQIHHFPTSQSMLYLFNSIVPYRLGRIGAPQQKTKILKRQRRNPTAKNTSQSIHIINITHRDQFRLGQINPQTGDNFEA